MSTPEIDWEIEKQEPQWLPKPEAEVAPSTARVMPLGRDVDLAFATLADKLAALAAERNDPGFPIDTHLAQALVGGLMRVVNASGVDLADFVLMNPFLLHMEADTVEGSIEKSAEHRAASAERARQMRAAWFARGA